MSAVPGERLAQYQAALKDLFENNVLRQKTIAHVCRQRGNRQDGEDVYQEAVILLDRKVRQGDYRGEGSLDAFFMGIVRQHWFNERRRNSKSRFLHTDNPPELPAAGDPEQDYLLAERQEQLGKLLKQLNHKCRKILILYQLGHSMDDIARVMGYANSNVAKKETCLCRRRFLELLKAIPEGLIVISLLLPFRLFS
ncbi:MAG: RNA polymerase sigma factor [Saprospiraceae bacterium]|nr:RNA polymerase sigma factor [Saprospiraceae bacterium]